MKWFKRVMGFGPKVTKPFVCGYCGGGYDTCKYGAAAWAYAFNK